MRWHRGWLSGSVDADSDGSAIVARAMREGESQEIKLRETWRLRERERRLGRRLSGRLPAAGEDAVAAVGEGRGELRE